MAASITDATGDVMGWCSFVDHQSAVYDNRIYVDGGLISYTDNATIDREDGPWVQNEYLYYVELDEYVLRKGNESNLVINAIEKPKGITMTTEGALFQHEDSLYHYGGENGGNELWQFNMTTNEFKALSLQVEGAKRGSYAVTPEGVAWYLSGIDTTTDKPSQALVSMDLANMTSTRRNITEFKPIVNGALIYVPQGQVGVLVALGGSYLVAGDQEHVPITDIWIYDIYSDQWASQTAYESEPKEMTANRDTFCALGVGTDEATGTFQIVFYGGYDDTHGSLDGLRALSIPDFTLFMYSSGAWGQGISNSSCVTQNQGRYMTLVAGAAVYKDGGCNNQLEHYSPMGLSWFDVVANNWTDYDQNKQGYEMHSTFRDTLGSRREPMNGWDSKLAYNIFSNQTVRTVAADLSDSTSSSDGATETNGASETSSTATAVAGSSSMKGSTIGGICGGVLGCLLLAGLAFVFFFVRRKKHEDQLPGGERDSDKVIVTEDPGNEKIYAGQPQCTCKVHGNTRIAPVEYHETYVPPAIVRAYYPPSLPTSYPPPRSPKAVIGKSAVEML